MRSSIKTKVGACQDCPSGSKEKPLTAKRCYHHYRIHLAEQSEFKKKKRAEMNAFLGVPEPVKDKPKAIPRRSKKRIIEELQYNADVKVFLGKPENRICPVTGEKTSEVHHKRGRIGALLLDQRYWLAVSRKGHQRIENEPEWAKEMGFSLSRLEKITDE